MRKNRIDIRLSDEDLKVLNQLIKKTSKNKTEIFMFAIRFLLLNIERFEEYEYKTRSIR